MRGLIACVVALVVSLPALAGLIEDRPKPLPPHWPTPSPAVAPIGREIVLQDGTPPVAQFGLLPQSAAVKSQSKPVAKAVPVYRYSVRRSCGPGGCR